LPEKVNTYQIIINSLFYFIFICLFISWTVLFVLTKISQKHEKKQEILQKWNSNEQ